MDQRSVTFVLGLVAGIVVGAVFAFAALTLHPGAGRSATVTTAAQGVTTVQGATPNAAELSGTWACPDGMYSFEFRPGAMVAVYVDGYNARSVQPCTYRRLDDRIYVRMGISDLGLRIVDASTLQGEGLAEGTYTRQEKAGQQRR